MMCLFSLLTCHDTGWARLIFANVSFYYFSSCRLWAPYSHLPCHLVGFPSVILEGYNAPTYVMSRGHACLICEGGGLNCRSVQS